jgi:hypothetical protein
LLFTVVRVGKKGLPTDCNILLLKKLGVPFAPPAVFQRAKLSDSLVPFIIKSARTGLGETELAEKTTARMKRAPVRKMGTRRIRPIMTQPSE